MRVLLVLLGSAFAEFPSDCPNITVIHDVVGDNWYDGCLGLDKKPDATSATACEEQCKTDMNCSIWQMTDKACWSGNVVHGCRSRGSDSALGNFEEDLKAGQRIQHGFIKVVSTDTKKQVLNLKHYPEKTGDQATQIARCKEFCYTDVTCTVWQYGSDGCWVEHLPGNAAGSSTTNSTWAEGMLAGETIEHTCPPYEPEGLPWPWIIAGIVLALLAIIAAIVMCQKKPKVKKTRAVKIEPKPEPAPIMYFVPQPTMLIPQQSMVMQQPLISTSVIQAPTYTTAAPTTYTTAAPTTYTTVPQTATVLA